jgi:signal transduction histidine kinase
MDTNKYRDEERFLRTSQELLEQEITKEELVGHYRTLLEEYEKLLKETRNMSQVTDSYQQQLIDKNKQLRELEFELTELNDKKDKLFSIIAHDLRGPLGTAMNLIEVLVEFYDSMSKEEVIEWLLRLNTSSKHTYYLLENLLHWSRRQRGEIEFAPEELNIGSIITDTQELLSVNAGSKQIELVAELKGNLEGYFDRNMMETVLRNLASNAIKFTKAEGQVTISAKREGDDVILIVKDNGVGIREEIIPRLFEPVKNKTTLGTAGEKGTGLGLILCKEFVEKHDGKISVDSIAGEGTTFTIVLPALKNKPVESN